MVGTADREVRETSVRGTCEQRPRKGGSTLRASLGKSCRQRGLEGTQWG